MRAVARAVFGLPGPAAAHPHKLHISEHSTAGRCTVSKRSSSAARVSARTVSQCLDAERGWIWCLSRSAEAKGCVVFEGLHIAGSRGESCIGSLSWPPGKGLLRVVLTGGVGDFECMGEGHVYAGFLPKGGVICHVLYILFIAC
jgi:hypothetical protein